jgi:hypothetical protein
MRVEGVRAIEIGQGGLLSIRTEGRIRVNYEALQMRCGDGKYQ